MICKTISISLILFHCTTDVIGHAHLVEPTSRNLLWSQREQESAERYYPNRLNCGGFRYQWISAGGRCGVCGDPFGSSQGHVFGGKYVTDVVPTCYEPGQLIGIKVKITSHRHRGYFQFRVADARARPITQQELDKHLLQVFSQDGKLEGYQYNLTRVPKSDLHYLQAKLPDRLSCNRCVLQWWYETGDSFGCDKPGDCGFGKGPQETFVNCADIKISPRSCNSSVYNESTIAQNTSIITSATAINTTVKATPMLNTNITAPTFAALNLSLHILTMVTTPSVSSMPVVMFTKANFSNITTSELAPTFLASVAAETTAWGSVTMLSMIMPMSYLPATTLPHLTIVDSITRSTKLQETSVFQSVLLSDMKTRASNVMNAYHSAKEVASSRMTAFQSSVTVDMITESLVSMVISEAPVTSTSAFRFYPITKLIPPAVTPTREFAKKCSAINLYLGDKKSDLWCLHNCNWTPVYCPETICSCEGD